MVTSGIRIGTPAVTTREMKEEEMKEIAVLIATTLKNAKNESKLQEVREAVKKLCEKFPLYKERITRGKEGLQQE